MISCIILAAGSGSRMQCKTNKVFLPLGAYTVIQRTLLQVKEVKAIEQVILVAAAGEEERMRKACASLALPWPVVIVSGGATRQASVQAGLDVVSTPCEMVLIHDGARPLADAPIFERVIEGVRQRGAAVAAVPSVDTVKHVDPRTGQVRTLRREELVCVQTPQGIRYDLFLEAQAYAKTTGFLGTDDVSLVEHYGKPVAIVAGHDKNIKVTTPKDLLSAKVYLGIKEQPMMRVGFGYDVHRLTEGRPCVLGGVTIPSAVGPDGHSDADVLIHALMDALLGAAGLRDIGYYFPPEDDAYLGISSLILLERVNLLLKEKGFSAYNVDVMVIAEVPKLKPYIENMKENLARVLALSPDRISIKATTNEGLGALGRQEGIAAQAVVTVYENQEPLGGC